MQGLEDVFSKHAVDARNACQFLDASAGHALQPTKLVEQLPAPLGAHTNNIFQRGTGCCLVAPAAVTGNGETVRLVTHLLGKV